MWRRERIIGLIPIYVADIWSGTCQFRIFVSGLIWESSRSHSMIGKYGCVVDNLDMK